MSQFKMEVSEARKAILMSGLDMSITKVTSLLCRRTWPPWIKTCNFPIYYNLIQMFWSRPYLCFPWLICTVRSDGVKESWRDSLMRFSECIFVQQLLCVLISRKIKPKSHWSSYCITLQSGPKPSPKMQWYISLIQ